MVILASAVLAAVLYGVGVGRVANALVVVAGLAATWLLYIHGKRRDSGGGGGGDRRRREKEMEAEVGGSGGHF